MQQLPQTVCLGRDGGRFRSQFRSWHLDKAAQAQKVAGEATTVAREDWRAIGLPVASHEIGAFDRQEAGLDRLALSECASGGFIAPHRRGGVCTEHLAAEQDPRRVDACVNDKPERISAQVNRRDRLARRCVLLAEGQERGKTIAASGLRRSGLAFLALAPEGLDPADDRADAVVGRDGLGHRLGLGLGLGQGGRLSVSSALFDCDRRFGLGQQEIVDAKA